MSIDELASCVNAFEAALHRFAWDLAHQVLRQALVARADDDDRTAPRARPGRRPRRTPAAVATRPTSTKGRRHRTSKPSVGTEASSGGARPPAQATGAPIQLELPTHAENDAAPAHTVEPGVAAEEAAPPPPAEAAATVPIPTSDAPTGRRPRWTRESVTEHLCQHLLADSADPAFLRRHGEPGLVTAAKRIFGRFESALNVANLELARRYPDGPPSKARRGRAVAAAAAQR